MVPVLKDRGLKVTDWLTESFKSSQPHSLASQITKSQEDLVDWAHNLGFKTWLSMGHKSKTDFICDFFFFFWGGG